MSIKLIPKHQTPSQPLVLQNDNTRVSQPVLSVPTTNGIDWIGAANNKIDKIIQSQPHSEIVRHPKRPKSEKEAATIISDPRKAPQTSSTRVIGLSPVDPVGEFVVGNAVLGKPLQWLGKGLLYGAAKYAPKSKLGNWSRAKIINSNMHNPKITGFNPPIQTTLTAQTKPTITINKSTVDMGKMIENNKFLDLVDEFAKKHGYPLTDRSVITSTRRTNKHARKILARHNTYARGIRPTTYEPDIKYITSQIGDNFTEEQALRFMATHPHKYSPEEVSTLWFSPESNAFIYGGDSKTAAVRRMYKLSPNRNNWMSDADFIVESHPTYRNLSWEQTPKTDIIDIWRVPKNRGTSGPTTELVTTGNMNFAGWLNPKKFKHRMSLNTEWTPRNIIQDGNKYIDLDELYK